MSDDLEHRPEKVLVSWSGGKDSAMALSQILMTGQYEVAALLTTVTMDYDRISMHGVRRTLLEQQAASLGLGLEEVFIPKNASNADYEACMAKSLTKYYTAGIASVIFGDIFLEDVRLYREEKLEPLNMHALFPLWGKDTRALGEAFVAEGFKAVVTCVDTKVLNEGFVGREFDRKFLSDLPAEIDPCGENGEFHTFVYDGPIFRKAVSFNRGEKVLRENRFYYCDIVP